MEKYDVISVVGEGSYGLVMRCRHRESGQYVAIKKFLETEDDPTVKKMAMREIRMLKKLRHENLVNMIEVFRRKKRFFLVFEYLEHTVLEELEARSGGLGYVTSRKHIYQVLRALDFIHSNDVIHRDIKPENVLVSRLGVIKLCDFGFARPFEENETFTDYVATRWYRSPELLVGDPRYGKEVDIWATGCLYAEMMTGEPIFPGESDIDQLFQIVRVLGKLNARHQILLTRNAMFRGMKQEQNSSLSQLFPEWSRDSLDFLTQCLKMDTNSRPDTDFLLKHDLFMRDDFLDYFLPELKAKIGQEVQSNPLSRRLASTNSGKKNLSGDDKHKAEKMVTINKKSLDEHKLMNSKERIAQIGLSLLSSSQYYSPSNLNSNNGTNGNSNHLKSINNATLLDDFKNNNTNNINTNKLKHLNISNLTFKDSNNINSNNNNSNSNKYSRILSAKTLVMGNNHQSNGNINSNAVVSHANLDLMNTFQPPSPVQFQSLQPDFENKNSRRNSPLANFNNLTINGNILQLLNSKRAEHQNNNNNTTNRINNNSNSNNKHSPTPLQQLGLRTNLVKRERGLILNPTSNTLLANNTTNASNGVSSNINNNNSTNETSPRLLQPPPWLMGNVKITSQGKITQIGVSKRGMTDWKTISNKNNNDNLDFLLPNCPGASTSPFRGLKKKLSPMSNHDNASHISQTQSSITSPTKNSN